MCGCMSMEKKVTKKYTNEEKKELVLAYLKDKYGEEFEGMEYKPEQLLQENDEFYLYSKSRSKKEGFQVWGATLKDGTYKMRDGYFGIMIHDEYEKVVREIVSEYYGEFKTKVMTTIDPIRPDALNKSTKVSEIYSKLDIKTQSFYPEIWLYIKKSSTTEKDTGKTLEKISQKMVDMKLTCCVYIFVINDDQYENVFAKDFEFNSKNLADKRKKFTIDSNLKIEKDWEAK